MIGFYTWNEQTSQRQHEQPRHTPQVRAFQKVPCIPAELLRAEEVKRQEHEEQNAYMAAPAAAVAPAVQAAVGGAAETGVRPAAMQAALVAAVQAAVGPAVQAAVGPAVQAAVQDALRPAVAAALAPLEARIFNLTARLPSDAIRMVPNATGEVPPGAPATLDDLIGLRGEPLDALLEFYGLDDPHPRSEAPGHVMARIRLLARTLGIRFN